MVSTSEALQLTEKPMFIKFVEYYLNDWLKHCGWGRWLHEYQVMEKQGLFKPNIFKVLYIKELKGTLNMGFIREEPIHYVGLSAIDATKAYYDAKESYLYKICVITGEIAQDDDGDEYIELTYDEATQICKSLNDEAEEILFKIQKM
jgi:hypothetical protein